MRLTSSLLAFMFGFACGGAAVAPERPSDPPGHGVGEHHDMETEHHGVGVAEIDSFHATLAPIWHSDPGDARTQRACDAVPHMKEQATAIVGRARADHAGWEGDGTALVAAVGKLGDACAVTARPDFDAAFAGVHDAYHALMESAMPADAAGHEHVGH